MRKREWSAAAKKYEKYCRDCLSLADEFDRRALSAKSHKEMTDYILNADELREMAHAFREESVRCSWNFTNYTRYKHNQNKSTGEKSHG